MKNILFLLAFGIFGSLTATSGICQIIFEHVSGGGNRAWNDSPSLMCLGPGTTCKRTVIYCDDTKSTVNPASGGGYLLSGKITQIGHESVGISPAGSFTTSGASVSFLSNEYTIRLQNCSPYTFLNGVVISADNVTTNSDGEFSVFVPVYQ